MKIIKDPRGQSYTQAYPALPPELQTSRWGWSKYAIRVLPGMKVVRLHLVEPTFTSGGKRVFDIRIDGVLVAAKVDIFKAVGNGHDYVVTASDGLVTVARLAPKSAAIRYDGRPHVRLPLRPLRRHLQAPARQGSTQ